MTDKTEAQPEALRLELHQECADFATSLRSAANVVQLQGQKAPPSFLKAADLFEQAASEIQQLKAQLSARQAAPTGLTEAVFQVLEGWNIPAPVRKILETAYYAPPPPEREPLSKQQVSKIALDLLMANCTWHALQNTGFFHEIVPFTVEIVAAAERAHGIGASNDNP